MEEGSLLMRLQAGDLPAQEELVRTYQIRLKATAGYFLGPQDPEVEDIVQDTFIAALRAIAKFEGRSSLYTWLNHICVNQCFDRVRQRKRRLARETDAWAAWLQQNPPRVEAEAQMAEKEQQVRLKTGMDQLGQPCAELLALRFQQGLALNEIKERLKVPMGTVASRLQRCLQTLRKKVGQV